MPLIAWIIAGFIVLWYSMIVVAIVDQLKQNKTQPIVQSTVAVAEAKSN